jgi:hypothetical protein
LPIGDISTLLSPEAAAFAGAITLSNQQRRLDAEVKESATLASEMGIIGGGAFGTWPLNNGNHPLISCTIGYMVHIYLM